MSPSCGLGEGGHSDAYCGLGGCKAPCVGCGGGGEVVEPPLRVAGGTTTLIVGWGGSLSPCCGLGESQSPHCGLGGGRKAPIEA